MTPEHPVWSADAQFDHASRTNRLTPTGWDFRDASLLHAGRKRAGQYVLAPSPAEWPCGVAPRLDLAPFVVERALAWGARWVVEDARLVFGGGQQVVPRWITVDEDVALLFGLYLAEGWSGDHQVCLAFHQRETHLHDFVRDQMCKLFAATTAVDTKKDSKGVCVRVNSVLACRFFKQFGKRAGKGLPWAWMRWPVALRLAVVRGWLMGDGHASTGNRASTIGASAVSVAPAIIYQAQLAMWAAGLAPNTIPFAQSGFICGKPVKQLPATRLSISARDFGRLLAAPTDVERAHWPLGKVACRDRTNSRSQPVDGGCAIRLASVLVESDYDGLIYNLHVEEDESFVVGKIAVHNSWFCREGAAQEERRQVPVEEEGVGW